MTLPIPSHQPYRTVRDHWMKYDDCAETSPDKLCPIPKDDRRRYTPHYEFIEKMVGHGFTSENRANDQGYYTFEPDPVIPIRFIVLDTLNYDGGWQDGNLSGAQVEFLKAELERAKKDKKLVVVASHHPSTDIKDKFDIFDLISNVDLNGSAGGMGDLNEISEKLTKFTTIFKHPTDAISGEKLREILHQYPNVICHLVGHGHRHKITPWKKDGGHAYWEIQTSSTIDYPQDGRLIDFVYEGNGRLAIYTAVVNPLCDETQPTLAFALESRKLALSDVQYGRSEEGKEGTLDDRNVILYVDVPRDIQPDLDRIKPKK